MAKLVKEIGNKEKCPTCQSDIICGWGPEYEGEKKLQWQNPETGNAHYNYDASKPKGDQFSCNTPHNKELKQVEGLANGAKLDEIIVTLKDIKALLTPKSPSNRL